MKTNIEQLKADVDAAQLRHKDVVAAQVVADEAVRVANGKRSALVSRQEGNEARAKAAREQLAALAWDGEAIQKAVAPLLSLQGELDAVNLALSTIAQRETFNARQASLNAQVDTIAAELAMETARLDLHEAEVLSRLSEVAGFAGGIETTSLGAVASQMRFQVMEIGKRLKEARRVASEHMENNSK